MASWLAFLMIILVGAAVPGRALADAAGRGGDFVPIDSVPLSNPGRHRRHHRCSGAQVRRHVQRRRHRRYAGQRGQRMMVK